VTGQTLHRWIGIATRPAVDGIEARAAVEDDFHNFRVALLVRDGHVRHAVGTSRRFPWRTCSAAGGRISELVGMAVSDVAQSVVRYTEPALQCTHMLDLAGLAVAAVARGDRWREYRAAVPRRIDDRTRATLDRDGRRLLDWGVDGVTIVDPYPFAGQNLRVGFARWAFANLDTEIAEAALILRRCVVISLGRVRNLDMVDRAQPDGHCFSQQPDIALNATRMLGSTWDFTAEADRPGRTDKSWLRFTDGE